jgi:hypothetical protein
MNAYEIPHLRYSLPAGGAVAQRRFISVDSNGNGIQATASTQVVGVSMNQVATGQVLEVADGIVMVEAAAQITAGTNVSSDADGKAIEAVAQTQSGTTPFAVTTGTIVAGVAVTGAVIGGLIAVKL